MAKNASKVVVPRGRPLKRGGMGRKRRLLLPPDRPTALTRRFGITMTDEMWEGVMRLHNKGRERSVAATLRAIISAKLIDEGIAEIAS